MSLCQSWSIILCKGHTLKVNLDHAARTACTPFTARTGESPRVACVASVSRCPAFEREQVDVSTEGRTPSHFPSAKQKRTHGFHPAIVMESLIRVAYETENKGGNSPQKKRVRNVRCIQGEAKSAPDKDPDGRDPISRIPPSFREIPSEPLHLDNHSIRFV